MNINGHNPYKKGFDMLLSDIENHKPQCTTPSACEPFDIKGSLFDSVPDIPITHAYFLEIMETLRISREALDNDEFALCAGAIDSAIEICKHLKHSIEKSGSEYVHKTVLFGPK